MICFFFNDTATTEIYTLSLHDALPIYFPMNTSATHNQHNIFSQSAFPIKTKQPTGRVGQDNNAPGRVRDRKSTRLNSSHANISYAVFCLKKKKISFVILTTSTLPSSHG